MKKEVPTQAPVRRLLKPQEAADELAISTRQLRALTDAGLIRYINVGRGLKLESRRYDPADIAAFIESRKQFAISPELRTKPPAPYVQIIDFSALRAERKAEKQRKRRPIK